ncbi:hypothetical protein BX616_007113, partial [Lobosporangium transversale]
MDTNSFSNSGLEIFGDFGRNPFLVPAVDLNATNKSSSKGCLDNSKSEHTATTNTHKDIFNIFNNNNDDNNNNNDDDDDLAFLGVNNSNYWTDTILSDEQVAAVAAAAGLDLTPELSPSMSLYSPAVGSVNSPYGFDGLGFDDFSPSPSMSLASPFEESFNGIDQLNGSLEFDFDFRANIPDMNMVDFQLFPDSNVNCAEPTSLKKPVNTASPDAESIVPTESPLEPRLDIVPSPLVESISPAALGYTVDSFSTAKTFGMDVVTPYPHVAPRKPVQSPTKPGFQPNKRRRRRRVTSEDAYRVVPEEQKDDPNAKARYKCSECDKTFSRPFNLRSHRATHLGVKPFLCTQTNEKGDTCSWAFARRHDLERH